MDGWMDRWMDSTTKLLMQLAHKQIPLRLVPTPPHLDRCPPVGLSDKEPDGLRYRFRGIGGNPLSTTSTATVAAASLPHDRYQLLGNGRGYRRGRWIGVAGVSNYIPFIHEGKNNQNRTSNKTETTTKIGKLIFNADRSYKIKCKRTHNVQSLSFFVVSAFYQMIIIF